ncbi:MAG: hypothetical protein PHQ94_08220 [Syntrophomonas sp.]|nr:hypothetical protein [Syntrophomonas sp.]
MELLVYQKGFCFSGPWQDLMNILSAYPPETTLQDFVKIRLS